MKRSLTLIACLGLLCGCAQSVYQEHELAVETLTLSEVYSNPPKVAAVLTGWTGVCERLEVRKSLLDKTFRLKVLSIYEGPADAACPAMAQEYSQTVILDGIVSEGVYNVLAGDKQEAFEIPADYKPETVEASIKTVDILLREMFPVQVVAYITYERGCDPTPYVDISQRREGNTFFISVRISTLPPEVPACPPVEYPVTEQVTLETQNLAPGTYTVNVNGVVKRFDLP